MSFPEGTKSKSRVFVKLDGFTLLEAVLSVALLALIAAGISAPYISGLQALNVQAEHMLLDAIIRSRMELLVGQPFDQISNGTEVVTINGENHTINWTVSPMDLNGDSSPESTAKQVSVSVAALPDRTLTTVVVDHRGRLGKL
jgi:type II secretory pathway pseudopilin PulG